MNEKTENDFSLNTVTVGIFWITQNNKDADIIFDSETYEAIGKYFINYKGSHFDMWDYLSANQYGGNYRRYDCFYFPRGRVLYNCETGKTLLYADQKILDNIDFFENRLKDLFLLDDYELCTDEHYKSKMRWEK